jgi:glycosyltransferase involved in cell wall biosynthesis
VSRPTPVVARRGVEARAGEVEATRVQEPEVSVIIPTRDRRDRVRSAIRSALAQRDVGLEVLVVDDASSDGTGAMVTALGEPRARVVRNDTSLGESGARNRGIDEAMGKWIAFLDDDDLWAPDKLARQLDALRTTGRSWAYGGEVVVDDDLNVLSGSPPPGPEEVAAALVRYNAVPGSASNVVVASELLARVGPFDPELRRTPDWDMWLRLIREGLPAAVNRPIVAIRLHPGNMSRDMGVMIRELDVIAARHGIPVDRARHHRWAAWTSLVDGRRADAFRHYARAVAAGDPMSVIRALAALGPSRAWPRSSGASPTAGRRDAWIEEARTWLAPLARERA